MPRTQAFLAPRVMAWAHAWPVLAANDATKAEAQEYKFTHPVRKQIEPKVMDCERPGETAVCAGVYQ